LCFSGCGKVGEPQAPFIRIPEAVKDLTASQVGYNIVLTWTNPAHNIDGSAAANLAHVRIRQDGAPLITLNAGEPGKPQSQTIQVAAGADTLRTFELIVDTDRGKVSNASNMASITPVEVPGSVFDVAAVADQRMITLTWSPSRERPDLADAYVVTRTDLPAESQTVSATKFEDIRYQPGKTVTYQVTPVRRVGDRTVTGIGPVLKTVTMTDTTPPQPPTGLEILESDRGAFLTWDPNSETDLAGYHVFRSDRPDEGFKSLSTGLITKNSFVDPDYKPGLYYTISAEDESGNESRRSPVVP
jgi:hypothetical protein